MSNKGKIARIPCSPFSGLRYIDRQQSWRLAGELTATADQDEQRRLRWIESLVEWRQGVVQ